MSFSYHQDSARLFLRFLHITSFSLDPMRYVRGTCDTGLGSITSLSQAAMTAPEAAVLCRRRVGRAVTLCP